MEIVETNRGACFTPNRFKTLCGHRIEEEAPHSFSRVIEAHNIFCAVCHERWVDIEGRLDRHAMTLISPDDGPQNTGWAWSFYQEESCQND
jgi:hypothetical protein